MNLELKMSLFEKGISQIEASKIIYELVEAKPQEKKALA